MAKPTHNKVVGFSLIELAVVIVIIGLILGGILVGNDLINSAEIRKQISQIDEIKLAHKTFKLKYDALAGDMCAKAPEVGLICGNATGPRDNGSIEDFQGWTDIEGPAYEPTYFFSHLVDSNLFPDNRVCDGTNLNEPTSGYFSVSINPGSAMVVFNYQAEIWLYLGINAAPTNCAPQIMSIISTGGVLTPAQSYYIDQKLDDGVPSTGTIRATVPSGGSTTLQGTIDTAVAQCVVDGTAQAYNVQDTSKWCRLMIKL